MEANKPGNDVVFFQDRDVAVALAALLKGEYRGASANLGIKHWIEVPKLKADVLHAWLRAHGRLEHELFAQAQEQRWADQPDQFFLAALGLLKRSASRSLI